MKHSFEARVAGLKAPKRYDYNGFSYTHVFYLPPIPGTCDDEFINGNLSEKIMRNLIPCPSGLKSAHPLYAAVDFALVIW